MIAPESYIAALIDPLQASAERNSILWMILIGGFPDHLLRSEQVDDIISGSKVYYSRFKQVVLLLSWDSF